MIFGDDYGIIVRLKYRNIHSICVYNWDYSEIEKYAKNALGQFLPTQRIHFI